MADEGALVCVLKPAECRPGVLEQPWQAPYPISKSSAARDQRSQRWPEQTPTSFSEGKRARLVRSTEADEPS
jgi:hypothetical protein